MKKLLKSEVCGSVNSAPVHCSWENSQQLRLEKKKKKRKRKRERAEAKR